MIDALALPDTAPAWLGDDLLPSTRAALEGGLARETWKHSPLPKTLRRLLHASPSSGRPLTDAPDGVRMARFSELDHPPPLALPIERYPLAGIVASLAADGWLIDVKHSPTTPLVLSATPGINAPVLLRVAAGCRVEVQDQAATDGFRAGIQLLRVERDGELIWNQAELVDETEQWLLVQAQLHTNASLELRQYASGARLRRLDTHVELVGDGASLCANGASVITPGTHLDRQLVVEHQGRNTKSSTRLHNIADGGRCSFNGRIHIHPGATAADADLTNRNLALDGNAEINTKPELEIYTDDVKCAHGATVGQLNDSSLFYLRSRGLPEPLARRLLGIGFLSECVEGPLAETVTRDFVARLEGAHWHVRKQGDTHPSAVEQ